MKFHRRSFLTGAMGVGLAGLSPASASVPLQLPESFPKTRLANCSTKEPAYRAGNGIDLGVLHFRENR